MQIQLTQDEIKEAVRQYISKDFNLDGRNLSISFTATRVPTASIVANLVLTKDGAGDTTEIPGFTNATEEAVSEANAAPVVDAAPAATAPEVKPAKVKGATAPVTAATLAAVPVVAADTATTAAAEAKTEAPEAAAAEDAQVAGDPAEAAEAVVGEAPKTTSLFG